MAAITVATVATKWRHRVAVAVAAVVAGLLGSLVSCLDGCLV